MPRIPTYIAEGAGRQRQADLPRGGSGRLDAIGDAASSFNQLVQTSAKIIGSLEAQQEDIDFKRLKSLYDASMNNAQLDLERDQDLIKHPNDFLMRLEEKRAESFSVLSDTAYNARSKRMFADHVKATGPVDMIRAKARVTTLWLKSATDELDLEEDLAAKRAGEAITDEGRKVIVDDYEATLVKSVNNTIINDTQRQARSLRFNSKVQERHMMALGRHDPSELFFKHVIGAFPDVEPSKQHDILEDARQLMARREARAEKAAAELTDLIKNDWYAKANYGQLKDTEIEDALQGKHPYITPKTAADIKEHNDKAPGNSMVKAINTILFEYNTSEPTDANARKAIEALRRLQEESGPHPALTAASDKIKNSTLRAIEVSNQSFTINSQYVQDRYREVIGPFFPGKLGTMMENRMKVDMAEARTRLRQGEKVETIIMDFEKRYKAEKDRASAASKAIQELRGEQSQPRPPAVLPPPTVAPTTPRESQSRKIDKLLSPQGQTPSRDVVEEVAKQLFPGVPYMNILRDPAKTKAVWDEVDRIQQGAR